MVSQFDSKLTTRKLLLAFSEIQHRGIERNGKYILGPLSGEMSHDGYTITISDEFVDATVGFHNSLSIQASNKQAVQRFKERIESINTVARC